jgi:hypothetical protein
MSDIRLYAKKHRKIVFDNKQQKLCAQQADLKCGEKAAAWLKHQDKDTKQNNIALLNVQGRAFRMWSRREKRNVADTVNFIKKQYYSTPTEKIWRCDAKALMTCLKADKKK